jgi:hypothetical protein
VIFCRQSERSDNDFFSLQLNRNSIKTTNVAIRAQNRNRNPSLPTFCRYIHPYFVHVAMPINSYYFGTTFKICFGYLHLLFLHHFYPSSSSSLSLSLSLSLSHLKQQSQRATVHKYIYVLTLTFRHTKSQNLLVS